MSSSQEIYVIEVLNSRLPCFITSYEDGDPPRTLNIENAQFFKNMYRAMKRLKDVKKSHPFKKMEYRILKCKIDDL